MFEKVLPGNTKAVLALLEKNPILQRAYLAGGTALALQIGHRLSYDLDFFTVEEFDENKLLNEIENIPGFSLEKIAWRTILGEFAGVRFSLFYYKYPLVVPAQKFGAVNVADIRDIAAMKIAAVAHRGTKRDFVDLYFISKESVNLREMLELYDEKYKNLAVNKVHILKSLIFFDDAEVDEMPKMLKKVTWDWIKRYFDNEVKNIYSSI